MPLTPVTFHPSPTLEEAMQAAMRAFGVQPDFYDIWGNHHIVTTDVGAAILTSLDVPCQSVDSINRALEEKLWAEWNSVLRTTIVTSASTPEIALSLPAGTGRVRFMIRWENGGSFSDEVDTSTLELKQVADLRGRRFERRIWTGLPEDAPLGYHELTAEFPDGSASARLVLCPDRAYGPERLPNNGRCAGVAVSLYGLRSGRNWGCGDFTDLRALTDWAADDLRASFIALNPLHSIPNRQPYNTSPYLPNSIFFKNPLYLDIERIPEFAGCSAAARVLESSAVQAEIRALREAPHVEYERCWNLKRRFLKLLFRQFQKDLAAGTDRAQAFAEYVEREGELLQRFAVYSALEEHIHRKHPNIWIWPDWPVEYRSPDSEATREYAQRHWRSVLFHKYVQWNVDEQLREAHAYTQEKRMPIGLYHDLALATDRCGGDLWAYRDFYVNGCRVGSPPDDFSPKGQDWAFPPPNTARHQQDGYRLFVQSIRNNIQHGGALRIDHVMRFFRLYWIPDNFDATRGTYVRDHAEDLIRLLALESVRSKVVVIGEDLGTVEPYIRETLHRFGILSYRLLYFERDPDGGFKLPSEYPAQSLVSISTHDLPTLVGFWEGRDIEVRRAAGLILDEGAYRAEWERRRREKQLMVDTFHKLHLLPDWFPRNAADLTLFTGELHNAVMGFLALAPSVLMCVNQEDITKDPEQQNLPGTTEQYPNWRHKMQFALEELKTLPTARDYTAMVRGWLERTGRVY